MEVRLSPHSPEPAVEIVFEEAETVILNKVFRSMLERYQLDPSELEPRLHKTWYKDTTPENKSTPREEVEEYNEYLRDARQERVPNLEKWISTLESAEDFPFHLKLSFPEADEMVTVLNDHRLAVAALNEITEYDMDQQFDDIEEGLKKYALFEIHYLGWIMEMLMRRLQGETD
jgi:hypothetical protein